MTATRDDADAADHLVSHLAAEGRGVVVIAAGGGAAAIARLVATPGASGFMLEGSVPYCRAAVDAMLGGCQESYASPRTARRLAVAAWQRARLLGADPQRAVGVAAAASLVSRTPKRGDHRVHVAVQTVAATSCTSLVLAKAARSRSAEEQLAAALLLDGLAREVGPAALARLVPPLLAPGEQPREERFDAPPGWQDLFVGRRRVLAARTDMGAAAPAPGGVIFPGSFDPFHEGHREMARIASEIAERPVAYELSVTNIEKPALDFLEIAGRIAQFAAADLWLTHAATFAEKLDVFPEATFVMGADTFARLADPRSYGGSPTAAAEAVAAIAARARGLIVFGRVHDGVFQDASQLDVPQALRDIAYFVSQREFRLDISSTLLRRRAAGEDASGDVRSDAAGEAGG